MARSVQMQDPTLNICNLSQALVEVTDYYGLGIKLGLAPHELKKIEADYQGVDRRKMEVLVIWLQGPNPQWEDLIVALQLINMRNTARRIQGALQRGEYTADSWLKPELVKWKVNYYCWRLLEKGTGALLLRIVALLFAVVIFMLVLGTLLYSVLGIINGKVNSGVPVKSKDETLEINTTDSIALFENLAYAPHNLPFLDPMLPFVGRENDVANITNIIVSYKVSIVGISGSPAFGKSTLAIHIGHKVAEKGIMVGYINADEDDLLSEVSEGIGTSEMLTTESVCPYFGKKEETMEDTKVKGTPKRWEEVKRWAAKLNGRALLVLDNCDNPLEEQDGELFKKIVSEIWEAGRGRLQLIITSQKKISFVYINFLSYPIKKLSLQSSMSLLKKMVEGFDVAMSDEQAEVIGNLSDGCPLALRIIGSELRSPDIGVTEMIHDLTLEILKVISDHSLQNVSHFQVIMNVAYKRLGSGMQYCTQQISFFPGSFDHQAGEKLVHYGFQCILVLVHRSMLDRYWTSYGDQFEK